MKSLKNFKTDAIKKSALAQITAGNDYYTTYGEGGLQKEDVFHDCNGDGVANSGDQFTLEDGTQITYP